MAFSAVLLTVILAFAGAQQNGDIRLEGGTLTRGRLEIFLNGVWGTICFDHFDSQRGVAQAACRQLGYNNFMEVNTVERMNLPEGTGNILLYRMYCSYFYNQQNAPQHLLRCDYYTGSGFCSHSDDMAVECENNTRDSFPFDTMVDITNEDIDPFSSVSSGFALVYLNGAWGPVCNMRISDADSFCRQLSYTNAITVGNMNALMDMDEVLDTFKCSTSQACLRRCFSYPKGNKAINCSSSFSFVTCTFDTDSNRYENVYGTQSICTISNTSVVAGAVSGAVLGFLLCVAIVVVSCFCYKRRRVAGYGRISSKTKYNSI